MKNKMGDQGSDRGKTCFVGPPLPLLATPATLNQPVNIYNRKGK